MCQPALQSPLLARSSCAASRPGSWASARSCRGTRAGTPWAGPRRVTSITASRWPRKGDWISGRDRRLRCSRLPPPNCFHSSETAGALGPLRPTCPDPALSQLWVALRRCGIEHTRLGAGLPSRLSTPQPVGSYGMEKLRELECSGNTAFICYFLDVPCQLVVRNSSCIACMGWIVE